MSLAQQSQYKSTQQTKAALPAALAQAITCRKHYHSGMVADPGRVQPAVLRLCHDPGLPIFIPSPWLSSAPEHSRDEARRPLRQPQRWKSWRYEGGQANAREATVPSETADAYAAYAGADVHAWRPDAADLHSRSSPEA